MHHLQLQNRRYGHALIRSDTSIRVYTTADTDTDTSTPCIIVSQPLSLHQAGCLENASYTQWVAHSIQAKKCRPLATNQLVCLVSFKTG